MNVSAVSIGVGTATANLSANVVYAGTGIAPSGGLTFRVDAGAIVTATCVGSSSPVTRTYSGYNTSALTKRFAHDNGDFVSVMETTRVATAPPR